MYNEMNVNKRVNDLRIGDKIGAGRMIFLRRNVERELEARKKGDPNSFVDAACPYCGNVKTYRLPNLKSGNTKSCGCMIGRVKTTKRTVDANGNAMYNKGYLMNFGWVYDDEADVDVYGNRTVNVHSRWVPEEKAIMPAKELDPVTNPNGIMMCSRWAQTYVEYHNIDVNKLIADADREIDDRSAIQAHNPHQRKVISTEADGCPVAVQAHGADEIWIKTLLMKDPVIAKTVQDTAYVADGKMLGKTLAYIGDHQAKYSDLKTSVKCDGYTIDVYEEYDGGNHPINRPSPRDLKVAMDCAAHNKGLFKISTKLQAFKDRDAETVLAIRKFAIDRIRANIVHNLNVGYNEKPTIIRVTNRRGIEEAITCDDQIIWCKMANVSDFMAACF